MRYFCLWFSWISSNWSGGVILLTVNQKIDLVFNALFALITVSLFDFFFLIHTFFDFYVFYRYSSYLLMHTGKKQWESQIDYRQVISTTGNVFFPFFEVPIPCVCVSLWSTTMISTPFFLPIICVQVYVWGARFEGC